MLKTCKSYKNYTDCLAAIWSGCSQYRLNIRPFVQVICRFLIFKYSHAHIISRDKWNQELIDVLTRSRNVSISNKRQSKAASLQQPEMITICKKEYMGLQDNKCANVIRQEVRKSKAASLYSSGVNAAQLINDFIFSRH